MALTPEDVKAVTFSTVKMKTGYSMKEVDEFLDMVESEVGWLRADNAALRDELERTQELLQQRVDEGSASEQAVQILAMAQKTSEETIATAREQAAEIIRNAEHERDRIAEQESRAREQFRALLHENLRLIDGVSGAMEHTGEFSVDEG